MYSSIFIIYFLGLFIAGEAVKVNNNLQLAVINQCEGKDAANYTYVDIWTSDQTCTRVVPDPSKDTVEYLITSLHNGQKIVNILFILARASFPDGGRHKFTKLQLKLFLKAYYNTENLYLITSGNLQGKFAYLKEAKGHRELYLKKCSSVLGHSFNLGLTQELMISEKLDLNILLHPGGAYKAFKKTASTICQGLSAIV